MRFKLEFDCDNAAFDRDDTGQVEFYEIFAVLGNVRSAISRHQLGGVIHDSNGARIGSWELG